jgi:hypothetical protein
LYWKCSVDRLTPTSDVISLVIPVIGNAKDIATWEKYALESDIIVEAIADYTDHSTAGVVSKALIELLNKHKEKTVLYTSGCWVQGDTYGKPQADERTPTNPIALVQWRPAVETAYTNAGAIVLRPGAVYGKGGSLFAAIYKGVTGMKID